MLAACYRCATLHNEEYCPLCNCPHPSQAPDTFKDIQSPNSIAPRRHENPYGRGIRRDGRGVPYLRPDGKPVRLGEVFDRSKYEETITINIPQKEQI